MPPIQRLMSRDDLWLDRVEHLEAHFEEEARKIAEKPRWKKVGGVRVPIFWPSSISDCMRKITYDFLEDPAPSPIDNGMLMADGDDHEERTAKWLEIMGFTLDSRQKSLHKTIKINGKPVAAIHGRIDGILRDVPPAPEISGHPNKKPYDAIWECKGLSHFTCYSGRNRRDVEGVVWPHYRDQAVLYMNLAGLENTIFTIKNKNNSELRFIEWFFSEARYRRLIKKTVKLSRLVKKKEIGPREYEDPKAKPCGWCRHRTRCWNLQSEG